jgi:signal peptidase II
MPTAKPAKNGVDRDSTRMGENGVVTTPEIPDVAASGVAPPQTRMRVFLAVATTAMIVDLATKVLIVATIKPTDDSIRLFGGVVYLVQARNSGAAFSVGTGATVMLTAISLVVAIVILRAARRLTSTAWAVSLGLVLGGAIGNLIDRFFRAPAAGRGHVVDWISLFAADGHVWPIFNVADSCIVIGGAIAVLLSLRGIDFNGRQNPIEVDDEASGGDDSQPAPVDRADDGTVKPDAGE